MKKLADEKYRLDYRNKELNKLNKLNKQFESILKGTHKKSSVKPLIRRRRRRPPSKIPSKVDTGSSGDKKPKDPRRR